MRASRDTRLGLFVAALLVVIAWWLVVVIDRYAVEHGHCPPLAMLDVELAQRDKGEAGRELEDVCHGSHHASGRAGGA